MGIGFRPRAVAVAAVGCGPLSPSAAARKDRRSCDAQFLLCILPGRKSRPDHGPKACGPAAAGMPTPLQLRGLEDGAAHFASPSSSLVGGADGPSEAAARAAAAAAPKGSRPVVKPQKNTSEAEPRLNTRCMTDIHEASNALHRGEDADTSIKHDQAHQRQAACGGGARHLRLTACCRLRQRATCRCCRRPCVDRSAGPSRPRRPFAPAF